LTSNFVIDHIIIQSGKMKLKSKIPADLVV